MIYSCDIQYNTVWTAYFVTTAAIIKYFWSRVLVLVP